MIITYLLICSLSQYIGLVFHIMIGLPMFSPLLCHPNVSRIPHETNQASCLTRALEAVQVLHSWRVSVAPVAGAGCVAGPGEANAWPPVEAVEVDLPFQSIEGCPNDTNHSEGKKHILNHFALLWKQGNLTQSICCHVKLIS